MKQKFLNIKKAIEQLEEIENLTLDARKTIKWNKENIYFLKEKLSYKKSNNLDFSAIQNRIYELECESSWQRQWIKDAKVEKSELENSLNLAIK